MLSFRYLLLAFCLLEWTSAGPAANDQSYFTARRYLESWNRYLKQKSLLSWDMDEMSFKVPLLVDFDLKSRVEDFSSLRLRGENQFVDERHEESETVETFDLAVGFDRLKFYNQYNWELFPLSSKGKFVVSLIGEVVRVRGTVIRDNGGVCSAVLESVHIEELGTVDVDFDSDTFNILSRAIGYAMDFTFSYFLPYFKNIIESRLQVYLQSLTVEENFSRHLCNAL